MNDNDFRSLLEMCSSCSEESEASDGVEMLMANLAKIHEYSGEMMQMISGLSDVEDWIEDKISKASQSLSDAKHYVEYRNSAYSSQSRSMEMHGGDVNMAQRMSVAGNPQRNSERMPIMTQLPAMTPQSSMSIGDGDADADDAWVGHSEEAEEVETTEDGAVDGDDEMMFVSLSEMWNGDDDIYGDDDYEEVDDYKSHLQPKTLNDIQPTRDTESYGQEANGMALQMPHILVNDIKQLARDNQMEPTEYLASLGFSPNDRIYKLLDKNSLWNL